MVRLGKEKYVDRNQSKTTHATHTFLCVVCGVIGTVVDGFVWCPLRFIIYKSNKFSICFGMWLFYQLAQNTIAPSIFFDFIIQRKTKTKQRNEGKKHCRWLKISVDELPTKKSCSAYFVSVFHYISYLHCTKKKTTAKNRWIEKLKSWGEREKEREKNWPKWQSTEQCKMKNSVVFSNECGKQHHNRYVPFTVLYKLFSSPLHYIDGLSYTRASQFPIVSH